MRLSTSLSVIQSKYNRTIALIIIISLIALSGSLQSFIVYTYENHYNISPYRLIAFNLLYWWFWLLLLPVIKRLNETLQQKRMHLFAKITIHFFAVVSVLIIHQAVGAFLCNNIIGKILYLPFFEKIIWRILHLEWIFVDLIVYIVLFVSHYAIQFQQKIQEQQLQYSQLEARLAQAQLSALKSQIQPHFLFNSMNVISTLIVKGSFKEANSMLSLLSDFLRMTIDDKGRQEIKLEEELLFIERYLEIEKIRFQDKLEIDKSFESDSLNALVPSLILQPLVENSIKHAISRSITGGRLTLISKKEKDTLLLEVKDSGKGINPETLKYSESGIGLKNTKDRLEQLYGEDHQFLLENLPEGGLLVTIKIPFKSADSIAESTPTLERAAV